MANKYIPTQKAINNPRRVLVKNVWVGVGGDIKITRKPPKKSTVIKEATPSQYKTLFEKHKLTSLVELKTSKSENDQ